MPIEIKGVRPETKSENPYRKYSIDKSFNYAEIFYLSRMKHLYILFTFIIATAISFNGFGQCTPLFGKLVINEIMPANKTTAPDPFGEYDDWVEIYNSTDEPINMEGYFLSDSRNDRTKFVFPNVVIDPNGFLIIWCDGQPEQGELHANFKLSASGEHVGLYNPDTLSIDYLRFKATPDDVSIGRFPNGHGPFSRLMPTFDSHNTNSVGLGVVINEYQAINHSTAQDQWGAHGDWIELYNNSNQSVDLTGYFLSDKIGDPTLFQFPDTVIAPDSYIIVWADNAIMDPGLHAFFKLGNAGDHILFSNPDTATIDYVRFGPQIPDDTEGRFGNGSGPIRCMAPTFGENNGFPTAIIEAMSDADFKVYPNPTRDRVHVQLGEGVRNTTIQLFDMQGKLLHEEIPNSNLIEISVTSFSPGIYFLRVGIESQKFVVY